ncbi:hypothetical protein ABN034_10245 [Actinopolymorpha sp. B11F2]|uniref:hypothetical protein n=1 Tax=Actinopolymorpha sp. B11F2 TaxID=3160862 RepID=UPI0032E4DB72
MLTGIDFCNIEEGHPPKDAAAIFHAVQDFNAANPRRPVALRTELADLAALPDGASVTVDYDAARLDEVRRRQTYAMGRIGSTGAVIEVCPTSNRRIGGIVDPAHHPARRFVAAGLPVVVSSDDPGNFSISLGDELDWVCEHTGGGAELRQELIRTAWTAASLTSVTGGPSCETCPTLTAPSAGGSRSSPTPPRSTSRGRCAGRKPEPSR